MRNTTALIILSLLFTFALLQYVADNVLIYFYMPSCPYCIPLKNTWLRLEWTALFDPRFNAVQYDITTAEGRAKAEVFGVRTVPNFVRTTPKGPVALYDGDRTYESIVTFARSRA